MTIRSLLTGEIFDAVLSTDAPVVLIDGQPCDPVGLQIIHATSEELAVLPWVWRGAIALQSVD